MSKLIPPSRYLRMLCAWIWLGKWYVAIILVVVATICWLAWVQPFGLLGHCKERDARWIGWLLQAAGFWIIAWGYNRDAKQQERLSPRRWFKQFPSFVAKRPAIASAGGFIELTGSARAIVINNTTTTSTIEERLAAFEANTKAYFNETSIQTSELRATLSCLRRDFDDHRNKMSNTVSGLGDRIVESVSGRVQLNLFAVALFLVGITLATLSPEIASGVGFDASCSQPLF